MSNKAMMAPTYTRLYIEDKSAPAEKSIPVQCEHENGFSETVLREADRDEVLHAVLTGHPIYVAVPEDALVYPHAKYDFVEVDTHENDDFLDMLGHSFEPRYFQEATLVATPKMALI